MTDDMKGKVVDPAAAKARDRGGHRWMAVAVAGMVVSFLALAAILYLWGSGLQRQVAQLASSDQQNRAAAEENHSAATTLAEQVKKLGGTPAVQPPPAPPATPVSGPAGRGITGTAQVGGHLLISYSDNTSVDVGQIVGADGKPGPTGRGVTGSVLAGGHLVISYSDNTAVDAGQVVGRDGATGARGRGVVSMDGSTGRLVITYDDQTTQDAGPLPQGPKGDQGPKGATGPQGPPVGGWTFTDRFGTTYQCSRNPGSPDANATYSCPQVKPTSSAPPTLPVPTR